METFWAKMLIDHLISFFFYHTNWSPASNCSIRPRFVCHSSSWRTPRRSQVGRKMPQHVLKTPSAPETFTLQSFCNRNWSSSQSFAYRWSSLYHFVHSFVTNAPVHLQLQSWQQTLSPVCWGFGRELVSSQLDLSKPKIARLCLAEYELGLKGASDVKNCGR